MGRVRNPADIAEHTAVGAAHHARYTNAEATTQAELVKLDDFATPDDNTDLDFGTARHGLVPKGLAAGEFLKDDGTWAAAGGGFTMHVIPSGIQLTSNDHALFVPMFKDTAGEPDRVVIVTVLTTSTVSIVEYKRLGDAWVFDPDDCAYDNSVTLNFTSLDQSHPTAFAIDNPVSSGNRVVFIAGNNASNDPDTFEIDSIVLTPGSSTLTPTAVVIAGANQPTDTNDMSTIGIPLSITRCMTFFQDDAHFADITESTGTYTFTYTDAKAVAVHASMGITGANAREYSGIRIGGQVLLFKSNGGVSITVDILWELTITASLTEVFKPFRTGGMGTDQSKGNRIPGAITAIGGAFAVAMPFGGDGLSGQRSAYLVSTFPVEDM